MKLTLLLAVFAAFPAAAADRTLEADPPKRCDSCDGWNADQEPFRVFGNTYFVGSKELGAVLVASKDGLILVDAGLSQTAPLIDAHVRKLGFRTEDIRLIVNAHAHFDHAGGIHALQRLSGATVAASPDGARALEQGGPVAADPQFGFGAEVNGFPAVKPVRVVADGETLTVGTIGVTAHFVPGHTPGSTAWTWKSCEGSRCLNVVYADSLTAVSAPGFRFTGDASHPSLEPSFRKSLATVAALPCDILLATHPGFLDMDAKLAAARQNPGTNPFVDPGACRAYAERASKGLDERLAEEAKP
jgi:metallo-beta-lactamase class B